MEFPSARLVWDPQWVPALHRVKSKAVLCVALNSIHKETTPSKSDQTGLLMTGVYCVPGL